MSPRLWAAVPGTRDGSVYSPAHPQGHKKGLSGERRGWGGGGAGADLEVSPHPTWQGTWWRRVVGLWAGPGTVTPEGQR